MLPFLPVAQVMLPFKIEHPQLLVPMIIGFVLLFLLVTRLPIPFLSVPHYRKELDQREEEARQRIGSAVREADAARAEIIAEAEQLAHAIKRRSEEEIARERTRQRILFRQQLVKTALDSAEGAIRESSDVTVQRRLIGDFIALAANGSGDHASPRGGA